MVAMTSGDLESKIRKEIASAANYYAKATASFV